MEWCGESLANFNAICDAFSPSIATRAGDARGGVHIVPNDRALQKQHINLDSPLSISVEDISMKSALNLLLNPLGLTYVIDNEVLMITTVEQLGERYRKLAEKESLLEDNVRNLRRRETSAEKRQQLDEQARHHCRTKFMWLADAIKTYQGLAEELELRGRVNRSGRLSNILRAPGSAWVNAILDTEEYHEGLRVFRRLQQQHPRTLEAFYACICNVAEVFREPELQAKRFQEMAKDSLRLPVVELKSMPEDHELFRTPGISSREQWQRWADSMQTKFAAAWSPTSCAK